MKKSLFNRLIPGKQREKTKSIQDVLTPQMKDYMMFSQTWLPFVMNISVPQYSMKSVNTDATGLRWSFDNKNELLLPETLKNNTCSIVIGGSTPFGVGATSDAKTISSYLSQKTEYKWLNFSIRTHVLSQNLIYFLYNRHRLNRIDKILLFVGINDLSHFLRADIFSPTYGSFFSLMKYFQAMNPTLEERIFGNKCQGYNDEKFFVKLEKNKEEGQMLIKVMGNVLNNWKMIADSLGADIYFALQPFPGWMDKILSKEEEQLFTYLDSIYNNPYPKFADDMIDSYAWYKKGLKEECEHNNIPFTNINQDFIKRGVDKEWLFVDRAHFTDLGNLRACEALMGAFNL